MDLGLTELVKKKVHTEEASTSVLVFLLIGLGGWQLGTARKTLNIGIGWALLSIAIIISLVMGIWVLKGYKTKTWTQ